MRKFNGNCCRTMIYWKKLFVSKLVYHSEDWGIEMDIETKRLVIRDIRAEDAPVFAEMAQDGTLCEIGFDKDCGRWIQEWVTEAMGLASREILDSEYLAYTVVLKEDNSVVGSVGCSWYEDMGKIGVTYFIGSEYRNRGYASEALQAYIRYFFNRYEVSELIATVNENNIPSLKVIEKTGFRLTGRNLYRDLNDEKEKMYCFYEMKHDIR